MENKKQEIEKIDVYEFDERFYQKFVNGKKVFAPSTTYKLSTASPTPYGLTRWRGDVGNKRADEILEEAGEFGTHIHHVIERLIKGEKVLASELRIFKPKQALKALKCVQGFIEWVDEYKPTFLESEYTTWCDEYNFAGTIDLKCKIDQKIYIVDFKTSRSIHNSHKQQISAYGYSEKIDNLALLHLGNTTKKGWSFIEVDKERYFHEFVAISNLYETLNPNAMPSNTVFPEVFQLELTTGEEPNNQ